MYRHIYQYTHDIDWFFLAGNIPIHAASNGGLLPHNIYKISELQKIQSNVQSMEQSCGFTLNKRMLIALYGDSIKNRRLYIPEDVQFDDDTLDWMKAYSWSFAKMAQRGFYSFDFCPKKNSYFLVARPDSAEPIQLPDIIKQQIYSIYSGENYYSKIRFLNDCLEQEFLDFTLFLNRHLRQR